MVFVKAAISRTVHLRECPLPLYYYYSSEFMCPGPLSLCNSLVSLHPSLCAFCFHYLFCLHALLSLCMPLTLFPFHYIVAIIFIQQLAPLNLCFLFTTPDPLPPYCSSFLAFPSQFCFNCHIPCTTYLPILFYFYPVLLDLISPVPPFYPFLVSFLLSHCSMPPH